MSSRRDFIKTSVAVAAGLSLAPAGLDARSGRNSRGKCREGGSADIIIAGGGPAGIAAAVTAARTGRKVRLFEMHGALGGMWTNALMTCLIDFGKGDIAKEISRRLEELGARVPRRGRMLESNYIFEPEYMKYVCEQMCVEAGVEFLLHCRVVDVEMDASGRRIKAVYTESKSGRQRWTAKAYIDATGDGDLCERAGCGFDFGGENPGDNDQPATMMAIVKVDDDTKIADCIANDPVSFGGKDKTDFYAGKARLKAVAQKAGYDATYTFLTRLHKNLLSLSVTHEFGLPVDDVEAITKATVRSRQEIFKFTQALARNGGDGWESLRVVATAEQIGHRAARRVHGKYTITNHDIETGARFEDAVATSNFGVDVHATTKDIKGFSQPHRQKSKPFQIPFRSCESADVDNLYMIGRCISGGFYPMSSYRVTGTAVEMGENVGRILSERI